MLRDIAGCVFFVCALFIVSVVGAAAVHLLVRLYCEGIVWLHGLVG